MKREGCYVGPLVRTVRSQVYGQAIYFSIANPDDVIQSHHVVGDFYEPEELEIIARHFPIGGRFCDIGTNVGNHTLYLAKFLHAELCTLIEPNPLAIELLESNIFLNGIESVCDRRYLGLGLSDGAVTSAQMNVRKSNLGASRVEEGSGDIEITTIDALFADSAFDLMKIDVEGMEIKVLNGGRAYIAQHRPKIFIEVDEVNYAAFDDWVTANDYVKLEQFQRYPRNTNFMVGPSR